MIKIHKARWVVPISSPPIEDGAVAIDGKLMVSVGKASELCSSFRDAAVDDWGESAIIPGLINCHTHLELTAMRGYLEDVESEFLSWLQKLTIARLTRMSPDDLYFSALSGVA